MSSSGTTDGSTVDNPSETVTVTGQANSGATVPSSDPSDSAGLIKVQRYIGGLVADVTIEEQGVDEVAITQHPVEKTADITDHAYPLPNRLTVKIAWSPSGNGTTGALGNDTAEIPNYGDPTPMQTIYSQIIALKDARTLMEVQTGKRLYENMLIKTVTLVNDQETEYGLFISMELQEVILVETQTVTVPPNNVQQQPQKTANTQNAGTKNAKPNPPTFNAGGGSFRGNSGATGSF